MQTSFKRTNYKTSNFLLW